MICTVVTESRVGVDLERDTVYFVGKMLGIFFLTNFLFLFVPYSDNFIS